MQHASIVFRRHKANRIFEGNEGSNFGGWYFPFARLREGFRAHGIELSTADLNRDREVLFELHINVQRRRCRVPTYCYDYEHPHVRAVNGNPRWLASYRRVWTWNEALAARHGLLRLPIPNDLALRPFRPWSERQQFCVMIAKNKEMRSPSDISLYQERIRLIRGFEHHAPHDFALYGKDWDIPPVIPGLRGRFVKLWQQWRHRRSGRPVFPSWRGTVRSKDDVLPFARFALCYENLRGGRGYVTEKLFDCLVSGCIPVYAGAEDIAALVPADCYIDGDRFAEVRALVDHLRGIDEAEYTARQQAIRRWLASDAARRYDQEHWCRTLVDGIVGDLRLAGRGAPGPALHSSTPALPDA